MAHPGRQPSPGGTAFAPGYIEKHPAPPTESSAPAPLTVQSYISTFWSRLASWGVELRGIVPVDLKDRTDRNVFSLFVLWFTISCNLLPVITGMVGTVLYHYEKWAWIPTLISLVVATGFGGKYLANQQTPPPTTAVPILSFGGLLAGFLIPWAALSSDYCAYFHPSVNSKHVFAAVYAGLCLPNIPLMILGAAIGGAVPNIPSWSLAYETGSVGGILAAMLASAGGFGKFIIVLLTFSTLGNIAASIYSISLNFQLLLPIFLRVPRAIFAIVFIAIVIPVSIQAAVSFFVSLENFAAVISYWSATFVAIIAIEHVVFRKGDYSSYDATIWNDAAALPSGVAAITAGALSFALVVPCMLQTWFQGPIAKITGDIGFEVAMVLSGILYLPLRALEIKIRKRI
ncbi:Permease, cytosine/purines, uracil, thiamine, allantoin [Trichophyton rubrum]|nr:Permease, cytosine/purines, uracil, thiamine, allantoin [Trichophyton rubrum]